MSFLQYFDDDYFKIQDFVSILADSLPRLELTENFDVDTLIHKLIEQNKHYGRKIIGLYESVDNIYKNFSTSTDQNVPSSPDFTSRLHHKIQDYEDLIKKLTDENDEFSKQIKYLSTQIEDIHTHTRGSLSRAPFSQNFSPAQQSYTSTQSKHTTSNDLGSELESLFLSSEYHRACQLLISLDYRKPSSVPNDKFNSWLEISNRVKDTQLLEVLNKLKVLVAFSDKLEEETVRVDEEATIFDRIAQMLDDKVPKIMLKNEYELQREKGDKENIRPGTIKSNDHNSEHLLMKVDYLNNQLNKATQESNNKDMELRALKDKLKEMSSCAYESSLDPDKESIIKSIEHEVRMRMDVEQQLQDANDELIELRDRIDNLDKELEDSQQSNNESNELINKLIKENSKLREQCEFSEKLEDIEKYKEAIADKDTRIQTLTDELNSVRSEERRSVQQNADRRDRAGNQERRFINDTSPETTRTNRDLRSTLYIENALHKQASVLNSLSLVVSQITNVLPSTAENQLSPGKTRLSLRSEASEDGPSGSEVSKLLKTGFSTLQTLLSNLTSVKEAVLRGPSLRENAESHQVFIGKVTYTEDMFLQNVSTCFQTLSQLTSLLQNLPSDTCPTVFLPQTLSQLQNLHTNLNKTLEDFPDFSTERQQLQQKEKNTNVSRTDIHSTPNPKANISTSQSNTPNLPRNNFRDKLVRDQSELTHKLRHSLAVIQKNHREDIFSKLNAEIERSQELQEKLDGKDHLAHRLNFMLNEGVDRAVQSLTQLIKLADSAEAQSHLSFIVNEIAQLKDRFYELCSDSTRASSSTVADLRGEFDVQRQLWNKKIADMHSASEGTITKLIHEIQEERFAHEDTLKRLQDLQQSRQEERFVHEDALKKLQELQQSRAVDNELNLKIKTLQRDIDEKQLKIDELRKELRRAQQESKDTEFTRDEVSTLRGRLNERTEELRRREDLINELRGELTDLRNDVDELSRSRSNQDTNIERQNKSMREELRVLEEFKRNTQDTILRNSEYIEQMRGNYSKEITQLREESKDLGQSLQQARKDLEKKVHTVNELNNMLDSLQVMSNKSIETLKSKDEKVCELQMKLTEADRAKRSLESKVEELTHKNEKYSDLLKIGKEDISGLKNEVQQLISKQDELRKDLEVLRKKNDELVEENKSLEGVLDKFDGQKRAVEEKISKMNEMSQISKADYKNLKENLEMKNQELAAKEKELSQLNELLRRERHSERDRELVSHLRQDNNSKTNDLNILRNDLQKSIQNNERLNIEVEMLRAGNKHTTDQIKEMDRLNNINKALSLELESIRKNGKHRDEMHNMEKDAYDREMQLLQKKLNDQAKIIEEKDQQLKTMPRGGFNGSDSMKSQNSTMTGGSSPSFYASLVESKDLEIKRLTQIVRNLTENLKDTQESKYKLKKPR